MNKVAKFEKVSYEQFKESILDLYFEIYETEPEEEHIKELYDEIKLPKRSTTGSAGYDFYNNTGIDLNIVTSETVKIPTGIRCKMDEGWVLIGFPRSGLGFKYRLQLDNTNAVIDEDYYYSDNEGHIFLKITNDSKTVKMCKINKGKAFAQGIFLPYGITEDDDATGVRNGGFGSTDK